MTEILIMADPGTHVKRVEVAYNQDKFELTENTDAATIMITYFGYNGKVRDVIRLAEKTDARKS